MIVASEHVHKGLGSSPLVVLAHRGGVEAVDQLAGEWRDLCSRSAHDQIFYRPEFIRAHIRAMLDGAKIVLITVRCEGRLCLVLPLVEEVGTFSKILVRKLRSPANFNCGRFDAVRSSGPEGNAAVFAAWRYLRGMYSWDLLQLRYSQSGSTISQLAEAARAEGFPMIQTPSRPNPYVPLPPPGEVMKQLPRNARLRTKLRQIRRQMAEQGSFRFYCVNTADRQALDRLFALEESGWKGRNHSAVNCHPRVRQFFHQVAEFAAHSGYLRLYMLEFGNELIAAHYSLIYQGRCHSPVVAYDENFKQFAPGHLIVRILSLRSGERNA